MPGVEASEASEGELERRLADVDVLRRRVLNVVPHALRTPITTMRGLAEALATATETEIRQEVGPALQRLAALAEQLLDDLLLAAGFTTTLPTGEPLATPVVATARAMWTGVGGGRELEVRGDEVNVRVPQHALDRILAHLLDNAAKYGDEPTVLDVSTRDGAVRIAVESPGHEVADIGMVAEPFFRGERAVMLSSGLGVGLPVARALAVHAGGTLEIEGGDGGGLVVVVELQRA